MDDEGSGGYGVDVKNRPRERARAVHEVKANGACWTQVLLVHLYCSKHCSVWYLGHALVVPNYSGCKGQ